MSQTHLFALYTQKLLFEMPPTGTLVSLVDLELQNRIVHILRLQPGEQAQLFNDVFNMVLLLAESTIKNKRGKIEGTVIAASKNHPLSPSLHIFVGITKREAFEEMLYAAAQMGVTSITPLITKRIHKNWLTDKDPVRFKKIMVAGCEQAKQFVLPIINTPRPFAHAIPTDDGYMFICDPAGAPLLAAMQQVADQPKKIQFFIGPEGGFNEEEEAILADHKTIKPLALGKSILRTHDAMRLVVGAFRSLSSKS